MLELVHQHKFYECFMFGEKYLYSNLYLTFEEFFQLLLWKVMVAATEAVSVHFVMNVIFIGREICQLRQCSFLAFHLQFLTTGETS